MAVSQNQAMPAGSLIIGPHGFAPTNRTQFFPQELIRSLLNAKYQPKAAYSIRSIPSANEELELEKPLIVSMEYRENMWTLENTEVGITSIGPDPDSCVQDFYDEFLFVLKEYGMKEDTHMTGDAKLLKQKILQYVGPSFSVS